MNETHREIMELSEALMKRLPEGMWGKFLLTGGAAAFLYGSDRPFSHDMDFMIPEDSMGVLQKTMGLEFKVYSQKPVFHSTKAVLEDGKKSYDLVVKSVVEPPEAKISCAFWLTPEIVLKKTTVWLKNLELNVIPPELLVLIKLLAGRGEALGKYDLYDAKKILEMNPGFDFGFFKKLTHDFCRPLKKAQLVLLAHAGKLGDSRILSALESLPQHR